MKNLKNIRFGRLVAIEDVGSKNKRRLWRCVCDCGREKIATSTSLLQGSTRSCGCLKHDVSISVNTKHGDCGTRLYRIWKGMVSRCVNKGSTDYKWYGGKGVSVCEEWRKYEAFRDWARRSGYNDCLTIDRINPYEGYSPGNCRWATTAEQNRNMRRNYNAERVG